MAVRRFKGAIQEFTSAPTAALCGA